MYPIKVIRIWQCFEKAVVSGSKMMCSDTIKGIHVWFSYLYSVHKVENFCTLFSLNGQILICKKRQPSDSSVTKKNGQIWLTINRWSTKLNILYSLTFYFCCERNTCKYRLFVFSYLTVTKTKCRVNLLPSVHVPYRKLWSRRLPISSLRESPQKMFNSLIYRFFLQQTVAFPGN